MTEATLLQKMRNVIIANSTVLGYVSTRVYMQHPSTIQDPTLPCISFNVIDSGAQVSVMTAVNSLIQIDLWLPVDTYTLDDVLALAGAVRGLLHRQPLSDASLGLSCYSCLEVGVGPVLYDADIRAHHLPMRYRTVSI